MLEGSLSLLQLKEIFPLGPLPGEERGFFTTLSGFLMSQLGRVPTVGDVVEWGGYRFEVAAMQGRRAARVAVTPPPLPSDKIE
jgi:putative hemolysin